MVEAVKRHAREEVELVTGEVYVSDDHWRTVWRKHKSGQLALLGGPAADRIRYIAIVQHGGGRDDAAAD